MSDALKAREALRAALAILSDDNRFNGLDCDAALRKIDAALSALDQPSGVRVGVKPLGWQKHNVDGTIWDAPSIGGGYVVRFDGKEWLTIKNIAILARSATSDAAKAAAQADYKRRILSALDLSAIGAEGWRTMDSAPKDGTKVLLWLYGAERGEPVVARWYEPWSNWQAGSIPNDPAREEMFGIGSLVPVAWQPISPPEPRS